MGSLNINWNDQMYQHAVLNGKIHESLEDPISQLFYSISSHLAPYLDNIGITPNIITLSRLVTIFFAFSYFFKNGYYRTAGALYILAFLGDCLDGHIARRYNKQTRFGAVSYTHLTLPTIFAV